MSESTFTEEFTEKEFTDQEIKVMAKVITGKTFAAALLEDKGGTTGADLKKQALKELRQKRNHFNANIDRLIDALVEESSHADETSN